MSFEERYRSHNTPWEINRPDSNLVRLVVETPIKPCKALDIGCGTGNNVIWLAGRGFAAAGCDISSTAVNRAREKAAETGTTCSLLVLDFLEEVIPGAPFNLAFDRGCFHHFKGSDRLNSFAQKVAAILTPGGLWLSLTGNADEDREVRLGPPQLTALEIVSAVEQFFEILSVEAHTFDSDLEIPPKNWVCLMKKRPG